MAYIRNKSHRVWLERELLQKRRVHAITGYTNTDQLNLVVQLVHGCGKLDGRKCGVVKKSSSCSHGIFSSSMTIPSNVHIRFRSSALITRCVSSVICYMVYNHYVKFKPIVSNHIWIVLNFKERINTLSKHQFILILLSIDCHKMPCRKFFLPKQENISHAF